MLTPTSRNGLFRAVAAPTAAALALLAAIVGAVLFVSTSATDRLALAGQRHRVEVAVGQSLRAVTVNQEASTIWDDAVLQTQRVPLDLDWIDNNLGIWFHSYYGFDEVYLLAPDDQPFYAMRDGRRVGIDNFARLAVTARRLARAVRRRAPAPPNRAEQTALPGATELAMIEGRPAFLSVKRILPESEALEQPESLVRMHVAVRYLDRSFLHALADQYVIDNPRFVRRDAGRSSAAIRGPSGSIIGYIAWDPFKPGQTVRNRLLPALFAALLLIGWLIAALLRNLHRSRIALIDSQAQAEHQACHDSLTGLPNRLLFERRLKAIQDRPRAQVAVLLLDLDRFKNINDSLGHPAGDQLIREFAARLVRLVRHGDTIARLGGDEFAIIAEDRSQLDVEALADRILGELRRPFTIAGVHIHVGVSIGLAIAPALASHRHELVRQADIALYNAKENGRNTCRIFSPDLDLRFKSRIETEQALRDALSGEGELCLHYQPLVDGAGTIVGLEALLRWNHPSRGLILPDRFIHIAEETGLIIPLGKRVVRAAFMASRRWPDLFVAINLSPIQLRSPDFWADFDRILKESGADPRQIQLEVTERVLLDDDDIVRGVLCRLRKAGFKIVLDDFGTGYSSLSYLRKFRVDKIKIDGSFIRHVGHAADARAIVVAVLALADAIGLEVAAEGVETVAQRNFLRRSGCDQMQGHLFSPAMPECSIDAMLPRQPRIAAA